MYDSLLANSGRCTFFLWYRDVPNWAESAQGFGCTDFRTFVSCLMILRVLLQAVEPLKVRMHKHQTHVPVFGTLGVILHLESA